MKDNIEYVRRMEIYIIKEKIKKNPKYLHPLNKERQEDMKRLEFFNGYEFTCWMQQNGIMKNPVDIRRKEIKDTVENAECRDRKEYLDKCARQVGFKDNTERQKEYRHETVPPRENEYSAIYFGDFVENLMIQTFEDPIRMPYGNPGFDWTCKKGDKIDNKGSNLLYVEDIYGIYPIWRFYIGYNNIADWFILSAWDNRESRSPLYVWAFHKNDIVRGKKFWRREIFSISNTPEGLAQFRKYEVSDRLEKLKEFCNKIKDKIDSKNN